MRNSGKVHGFLATVVASLMTGAALVATAAPARATNGVGLGTQIISHTVPGHPDFHFNYDYNVSTMQIGNEVKVWWCGGGLDPNYPGSTGATDNIYYASYNASTFVPIDPPQVTFAEGPPGTWDSRFTCNPTVITGSFNPAPLASKGPFSYAMYYVGTRITSGTSIAPNQIGVAFSKDGKTWVRYPQPVALRPAPTCVTGIQSPSAVGIDGHQVRLFYLDWCGTVVVDNRPAHPIYTAVSPDGVNFATPAVPAMSGLFALPSLGGMPTYFNVSYDTGTSQWVADVNFGRGRHDSAGNHESQDLGFGVFTLPGSGPANVPVGTWTPIHQVDTNLTGYEINSYPAALHDQNGWIHSGVASYPNYLTYYTLSNPRLAINVDNDHAVNVTNIGVEDIGRVALTNSASLATPLKRYTGSNTVLATTGYVASGYSQTAPIGEGQLYESPHPGTVPLYNCQVDGTSYYYTSLNSACASATDRFIGLQGYALQVPENATIPLYSCRVNQTYFFVSSHADCEGQRVLGFLGYSLPD